MSKKEAWLMFVFMTIVIVVVWYLAIYSQAEVSIRTSYENTCAPYEFMCKDSLIFRAYAFNDSLLNEPLYDKTLIYGSTIVGLDLQGKRYYVVPSDADVVFWDCTAEKSIRVKHTREQNISLPGSNP